MNDVPQSKSVLISGMMRSGTTLLQRALDGHPEIQLDYQSNTQAFIRVKQDFLKSIGENQYHTLAHYNPVSGYNYTDFFRWAYSRDLSALIESATYRKPVCGIKEVLVEEFYPLLVERGVFCLNIVRDPRDVITSMSFGQGFRHTGRPRPVLFDLRNWRKSIHFGRLLSGSPLFKQVRFEDLISRTNETLESLFAWLGVERVHVDQIEAAMSEEGWSGNSSFGKKSGFDSAAVNNHVYSLPKTVKNYIESACWQEMQYLGYPLDVAEKERVDFIEQYVDPFPIRRPEFPSDYSCCKKNIDYEKTRVQKSFQELQREFFP